MPKAKKDLATTRVRQIEALKLRIEGHSYAEIAAKLDYESPSGAQRAALAVLDRTAKEPAEQLREIELARLDRLLAVQFKTAVGKGKGAGPACDRSLKIIEQRCRLLGLNAPTKQEHSGPDGGPIHIDIEARVVAARELEVWRREMTAKLDSPEKLDAPSNTPSVPLMLPTSSIPSG